MKYSLVLGAGGATAWVFHTGVIRTLQQESGLDPNVAEVIVGTSAGAAVGATLRAGLDVGAVLEAATRPPSPEQRSAMLAELKAARKTLRPLSPSLARHVLPGGRGLTLGLAGLTPPGLFPTGWMGSFPGMDLLEERAVGAGDPRRRWRSGCLRERSTRRCGSRRCRGLFGRAWHVPAQGNRWCLLRGWGSHILDPRRSARWIGGRPSDCFRPDG